MTRWFPPTRSTRGRTRGHLALCARPIQNRWRPTPFGWRPPPWGGGQIAPSNLSRGSFCQKVSSSTTSSVSTTQQLSDTTELIKAYKCLVYNWVTGPQDRCMDSTVPVRLANLRAWTRPCLADKIESTSTFSASHLSDGTWNLPAAKSTSKPNCLLCWAGIVWHFGTLIFSPAKTKSLSSLRARRTHG